MSFTVVVSLQLYCVDLYITMASQSESSSVFDVLSSSFDTPQTEISYDDILYIKSDLPARRRKGSKVSKIWEFGSHWIAIDEASKTLWRCGICSKDTLMNVSFGSSSNVIRHLSSQHDVHISDRGIAALPTRPGGVFAIDIPAFRREMLLWIVTSQQSFIAIENKHFQSMLLATNHAVKPYLVESGSTIRNWVQEEFIKATAQIVGYLNCALSRYTSVLTCGPHLMDTPSAGLLPILLTSLTVYNTV